MKNKKGIKIMLGIIGSIVVIIIGIVTYCMTGPSLNHGEENIVKSQESTKSLVVYFSRSNAMNYSDELDANSSASLSLKDGKMEGNTEIAAKMIQQKTGSDLYSIQVSKSYRTPFLATSLRAWIEKNLNMKVNLSHLPDQLDDYDVIYLGFPIWWYTEPKAVDTFLESYDFKGKTIIPFCTSTDSSIDESIKSIQKIYPDANVLEGLRMKQADEEDIEQWLEKINMGGNKK